MNSRLFTATLLLTLVAVAPLPAEAQQSSSNRDERQRQSQSDRQREQDRRWRSDQRQSQDQERQDRSRQSQQLRDRSRSASQQARTHYMAGLAAGYMMGYSDGLDDYVILVPQRGDSRRQGQGTSADGQRFRDRLRDRARQRMGDRDRGSRFRTDRMAGSDQQQTESQQFTGEIRSLKRVRLQNDNQRHTLLLVSNSSGRKRIIDAGPTNQLQSLDLQQGDRVTVSGRYLSTKDDIPVLNARKIESQGQFVAIRGQRQNEQSRR